MNNEGVIFNIQRFSVHDGPGIRSTVFFKGCSLHCFWCHNPEGLKLKPEVQFDVRKCIFCGDCIAICKNTAHINKDNQHIYQREKCVICGECIDSCFSGALEIIGKTVKVDEIMKDILQDRSYYQSSGGGVTLSGGEPVIQKEFALEILKRCKNENINTALETSGNYKWDELSCLLEYTDIIMMDLKIMDPEKHQKNTGVRNDKILQNAKTLASTDKPLIFRTPVIPTINDSEEEITEICKFVKSLIEIRKNNGNGQYIKYELLPFHKLASDKYATLGINNKAINLEHMSIERMNELNKLIKSFEI
jgi:pyruvate formate lyase activating enzyme